ncbi:MAG: glycine zipper 2TM domain-containing protein [Nautiliaceae bacterium]
MKKLLIIVGIIFLFFSGCSRMYSSNEVSLSEVNKELTYQMGVVEDVKKVVIKDNGSGLFVGAYAGSVLGSMFGKGKGNILSTLIGGLSGAFVGYEEDKANGEELFIKLDDGRRVVVIVKGIDIKKGDKVRLILNGKRIVRVEKV